MIFVICFGLLPISVLEFHSEVSNEQLMFPFTMKALHLWTVCDGIGSLVS